MEDLFLKERSKGWDGKLEWLSTATCITLLLLSYLFRGYSSILLTFIYLIAGVPIVIKTFQNFTFYTFNIDALMAIAAFGSIFLGIAHEGALLLVLFSLSYALEYSVSHKLEDALAHLKNSCPQKANVLQEDGTLIETALADIPVEAQVIVRAGEVVPLDGVVHKGSSSICIAHLTGESAPIAVSEGSEVLAGSNNYDATLTVKVTKPSTESTLSKILQLIAEAKLNKPKVQLFLDKFSSFYAISVVLSSFLLIFVMTLFLV